MFFRVYSDPVMRGTDEEPATVTCGTSNQRPIAYLDRINESVVLLIG
jgi:hypothetical protein